MKIALTGASGLVGRWIAEAAAAQGHHVLPLARPVWQLGDTPDMQGCDVLIHAAFQHAPGRYRGGEGDDPAGFVAANYGGSVALFRAAQAQGVGRVLFMSSRAVHDGQPKGTYLADDLPPTPTSLYGQVKADAEAALAQMHSDRFRTASLRPTGVFGPGQPQKWAGLFQDFLSDRPIASRVATEVHGADLAAAALLVLNDPAMSGSYNVSDLILDRHDLLAGVAVLTGCHSQQPARADASELRVPICTRLEALGWQPNGSLRLHQDLPAIIAEAR